MTILIGETRFPSKSAALKVIQAVLYRYPVGATVGADDADFLGDVLARHPERNAKIGPGVVSFQVEQNTGSRGFWLTRVDGSRTDWSFMACLTPPTPTQEAKAGFRTEIRDQIRAFRDQAFAVSDTLTCPITRQSVTTDDAHVDHEPPFETLLQDFLEGHALHVANVAVEPTRDQETDTRLADRALAQSWALFHQRHAGLRIVSRLANLSLLRRGPPV